MPYCRFLSCFILSYDFTAKRLSGQSAALIFRETVQRISVFLMPRLLRRDRQRPRSRRPRSGQRNRYYILSSISLTVYHNIRCADGVIAAGIPADWWNNWRKINISAFSFLSFFSFKVYPTDRFRGSVHRGRILTPRLTGPRSERRSTRRSDG